MSRAGNRPTACSCAADSGSRTMKRRGFTLTEVMIGLGLALFVVVAAFEFFGVTRALFAKLRVEETDTQSAEAALDKIRIDFRRAGTGLVGAMRASTVAGVEAGGGSLCVAIAERSYGLAQDLVPGQTRVHGGRRDVSGATAAARGGRRGGIGLPTPSAVRTRGARCLGRLGQSTSSRLRPGRKCRRRRCRRWPPGRGTG